MHSKDQVIHLTFTRIIFSLVLSAAVWLLESRVQIPLKAWMFVPYICCVLCR